MFGVLVIIPFLRNTLSIVYYGIIFLNEKWLNNNVLDEEISFTKYNL